MFPETTQVILKVPYALKKKRKRKERKKKKEERKKRRKPAEYIKAPSGK